ncbi:hypothetical protein SDC9_185623 [bioreactor metagenome]|uniref:Uncharacterized protein n=1 Tax=bioreactor metagenome TaxID=1076179 RepID=A0A645HIS9_9ZZZZ
MRIDGNHPVYGSVFFIPDIIEGRNIDAGNLSRHFQEVLPASAISLILFVTVQQVEIHDFALTEIEQIKKRRDRFRIVAAWAAADYNGIFPGSVFCVKRNMGQVKNLQNIGIAHFILERDA